MQVSVLAQQSSYWVFIYRSALHRKPSCMKPINPVKQPVSDRVVQIRFEKPTPERLDKFLTESLPEFSRSRIQGLIADGFVDVNGHAARKAGQPIEAGTSLTVRIPPLVPTDLVAEDIPLDILFENEDLL